MSKKQELTKFCSLSVWLLQNDKELLDAITNLCAGGMLRPNSSEFGVAFLYPKDKKYRQEILDKTYSDDAEIALKMIKSLMIPLSLRSAEDFKRGPVGTRNDVTLDVEDASGNTVTLKGGISLTQATNFTVLGFNNISVWNITAGRIPLEGEPYKKPERKPKAKTQVGAGGDDVPEPVMFMKSPQSIVPIRTEMTYYLEKLFSHCMTKDRCAHYNPYLAKCVSLLNFLEKQYRRVLYSVLAFLDFDPFTTFYILIEPYKTVGEYLISDEILFGPNGWNGVENYTNAVQEYKRFFNEVPKTLAAEFAQEDGQIPLIFQNQQGVAAAIDSVRQMLTGDPSQLNKLVTPTQVRKSYETMATDNTINGIGPIYPAASIRYFQAGQGIHRDETRFIVHNAMEHIYSGQYDEEQFHNIIRTLRSNRQGNDYYKEASLSDPQMYKLYVSPNDKFYLFVKFINSSDFLYSPVPEAMVGEPKGELYNPSDFSVTNLHHSRMEALQRSDKMTAAPQLSESAKQELQSIILHYGTIPPDMIAATTHNT